MIECIFVNPPHQANPCTQCYDTMILQCFLNKQFQKVSEDGRKRLRHCLDEDIKNKRRVE
jgi:hypothetical protein